MNVQIMRSRAVALMIGFAVVGGCSEPVRAEWGIAAIADVSSEQLQSLYAAQREGLVGRPDSLLADASVVALASGGPGSLAAVQLPTADQLQMVALERHGDSIQVARRWALETDLTVRYDGDDFAWVEGFSCGVAADAKGVVRIAYVHPWTWRLVCWQLTPGSDVPVRIQYELPWVDEDRPAGDWPPFTSVAWNPDLRSVHVLFAVAKQRTYLGELDLERGEWQSQQLSANAIVNARIATDPGGAIRLFHEDVHVDDGGVLISRVAELKPEHSVPITDPLEPLMATSYVAVLDSESRAHILYSGTRLWHNGKALLHWHESEGEWLKEEIDWIEYEGLDMDHPDYVPGDLRISACFDSEGRLHVAYFDYEERVVKHALRAEGIWRIEDVAPAKVAGATSIVITGDEVVIAFVDVVEGKVYVAARRVSRDRG